MSNVGRTLHELERADCPSKLLALVHIRDSVVKRSLHDSVCLGKWAILHFSSETTVDKP